MLKIKNLNKSFGGLKAVNTVNLEVDKGSITGLIGPNGAGKSSLLRLMAGLGSPAEGTITWNDTSIASDPQTHAERIHYLGHKNALKSALTARENLTFWAGLHGTGAAVSDALDALDMNRLADLPARLLSSGETRRLALARLIANKTHLWLMDEPTVGLDQESVERLANLISHHRTRGGMVVMSIHGNFPLENSRTLDLASRS